MVQRYTSSYSQRANRRGSIREAACRSGEPRQHYSATNTGAENNGRHTDDQWAAYTATRPFLSGSQTPGLKSGGAMLSVSGINRFYFLRDFHDMRCKYDRVRSIIRQQFNREPQEDDVFIMMSRNRRLVRLFHYDRRSCSLHEKRFLPGYQFMKVMREGNETVYRIDWKDVVTLLESPVVKTLKIQ